VGLRTSVEVVSYAGYLTALTESHSQWGSHDIRGYINVYTVSEMRISKPQLKRASVCTN